MACDPNGEKAVEWSTAAKIKREGIYPIGVIHQHPSIYRSWLKGTPFNASDVMREVQKILDKLEDAGRV